MAYILLSQKQSPAPVFQVAELLPSLPADLSKPFLLLVVNLMRPFTRSASEIVEMAREIEEASGLKITAMINNTHLKDETTKEMVWKGQLEVMEAARRLGIHEPVIVSAKAEYMPPEADPEHRIELMPMLREPWELSNEPEI